MSDDRGRFQLKEGRSAASFGLFKDAETDWFFKRTLEFMYEKAAEIGECLYAARRINEDDGETWISEWADLARRVEAHAEGALERGNLVTAREALWRASNYYRTAEYGTPPRHPLFHQLWERSVRCFQASCALFDPPIRVIEVPYEGDKLIGYFWQHRCATETAPTLIAAGGNDSSLEEVVWWVGAEAVRRGYNFCTVDYPGHRGCVHRNPKLTKTTDYHIPFKAIIDTLVTLPGVDDRLALTGYSFGGHVTVEVAAHEERLKAIVPNSPILITDYINFLKFAGGAKDMGAAAALFLSEGDSRVEFLKSGEEMLREGGVEALPPTTYREMAESASPVGRAFIEYTLWTTGRTIDEADANPELGLSSTLDDLKSITCPALGLVGAEEGFLMNLHADAFMEGISSQNKSLYRFQLATDGSTDHCQLDNRSVGNAVMYDWLNEVFDYRCGPTAV